MKLELFMYYVLSQSSYRILPRNIHPALWVVGDGCSVRLRTNIFKRAIDKEQHISHINVKTRPCNIVYRLMNIFIPLPALSLENVGKTRNATHNRIRRRANIFAFRKKLIISDEHVDRKYFTTENGEHLRPFFNRPFDRLNFHECKLSWFLMWIWTAIFVIVLAPRPRPRLICPALA